MIRKAIDPPGMRPARGVLPARPAMPGRAGSLDHSRKPLTCGSRTLPALTSTTVRALFHRGTYPPGNVPGNPIDAHLEQMTSLELTRAVSASQGLDSGCKATEGSLRGQEWEASVRGKQSAYPRTVRRRQHALA